MVKVTKEICGATPRMMRSVQFICDECGAECYPDGPTVEKLYQTPRGQLCWDCMLDMMDIEEVKE